MKRWKNKSTKLWKKGGSECLNLLNLLLVDDNNSVLSSARNGNNLKIRWCVVKCYSWMQSTQVLIEQSKSYFKLPFVLQSVCQQLARAPTRRLPIRWSAEDCFPFPKHRRFRPRPEHRSNNYTHLTKLILTENELPSSSNRNDFLINRYFPQNWAFSQSVLFSNS